MNIKTKGILSVIGACFLHILIGSYHTWSRVLDYYLSYLHNHDNPSITLSYSIIFIPFIRLIYTSALPLGVIITSKLGIYIPCIISLVFLLLSHIILIFSVNLILVSLAFILFGIGIGLSYIPIIMNSWSYFPKNKGRIVGIILTCFGSSSFMLKFIADWLINPNNEEINPKTGYYDPQIADNFINYLKFLVGMFLVLGIAGILIINPWSNQLLAEVAATQKGNNVRYNSNNSYYKLVEMNNNENDNIRDTVTSGFFGGAENIKLGLKSTPFSQLVFTFLLSNMFNSLHISDHITFGEKNKDNPDFLSNNILIWNIANGCFRLFWGEMLDNFNFKKIYIFSLLMQIFTFNTFYFVSHITSVYFLYNFLFALFSSCTYVVMPYSFYKIFGMKNGGMYFGISQFLSSFGSFGIPFLINYLEGTLIHYLILYILSSVTKMFASIVLCFLEEKRFDYGQKEKEQMIKNRFSTSINSTNSNF